MNGYFFNKMTQELRAQGINTIVLEVIFIFGVLLMVVGVVLEVIRLINKIRR